MIFSKKKQQPAAEAKPSGDYFKQASHWHNDVYTSVLISRNRYQVAFLGAMGCVAALALAIASLTPLEKTQLVVVHQQPDGYTWVSTTKASHLDLTKSEAQIKQSIADYIRLREGYHPETYMENAQLVKYFSNVQVEHGFLSEQKSEESPVVTLGKNQFRSVKDISIQLLSADNKGTIVKTKNVAVAHFTLVDKDMNGQVKATYHEQVFLTYGWQGEPEDPELKLLNYDGFTINTYEKTLVSTKDGAAVDALTTLPSHGDKTS